jgi:hypothetical protein
MIEMKPIPIGKEQRGRFAKKRSVLWSFKFLKMKNWSAALAQP